MLWTSSQQTVIDQFIQEIKTIGWFKQAGEPSEKYWVIDTIWEACDTYGHQMLEVWGQNSELIEQKALRQLKDEQIDAIFEAVSLAIGNEVYEALCDLEDKIGQETGEDQSGIEEEILDFIKRDTAWACIERLLGEKGFFSRILEINQTGHWACSCSENSRREISLFYNFQEVPADGVIVTVTCYPEKFHIFIIYLLRKRLRWNFQKQK